MKLDVFDAIVGSFLVIFGILAAIDVVTWIGRELRSFSRRLHHLEPTDQELLTPNAGFSLGGSAAMRRRSAARRHFTRGKELRPKNQLAWSQTERRDPSGAK